MPNYYIHERLAQEHRLDLLREAERERLLAQLPQTRHDLLLLFAAIAPLACPPHEFAETLTAAHRLSKENSINFPASLLVG